MKPKPADLQLTALQSASLAAILCGNVRRFRKWTLRQVAEHLGVSAQSVLRWERGERVPPDEFLRAYIALVSDVEDTDPGLVTIQTLLSHLRSLVQRHERRRMSLIAEAADNLAALGLDISYDILDDECLKHAARPCAEPDQGNWRHRPHPSRPLSQKRDWSRRESIPEGGD